MSQRYLKDHY